MIKCIVVEQEMHVATVLFETEKELEAFRTGVELGSDGSSCVLTVDDSGQYGGKIDSLIREHIR